MEDERIIGLFIARNEDAVSEAQQKYSRYCGSIAANILGSREDAEEAVNDTWLAAWNAIPPHIPARLQSFLGRLTRNISMNKLRNENAQKRGSGEAKVVFDEVSEWLSSGQDVEDTVDESIITDSLNEFLGSISETERNVFVRRYVYFQPVAEIAQAHGFSVSKVKSMLLRLRNRLRKKLEKEELL